MPIIKTQSSVGVLRRFLTEAVKQEKTDWVLEIEETIIDQTDIKTHNLHELQ